MNAVKRAVGGLSPQSDMLPGSPVLRESEVARIILDDSSTDSTPAAQAGSATSLSWRDNLKWSSPTDIGL